MHHTVIGHFIEVISSLNIFFVMMINDWPSKLFSENTSDYHE
jgi:hypothetical protein